MGQHKSSQSKTFEAEPEHNNHKSKSNDKEEANLTEETEKDQTTLEMTIDDESGKTREDNRR